MPSDALLHLLDEGTRRAIFERSVERLDFRQSLDLHVLRTCLVLATPSDPSTLSSQTILWEGILEWIELIQLAPDENISERLYEVADICLSNGFLTASQFHDKFYLKLKTVFSDLSVKKTPEGDSSEAARLSKVAAAYLRFLRCSFWLPPGRHHLIDADCVSSVSVFLGLESEDAALDTLSALLSLLRNGGEIAIASTISTLPSLSSTASMVTADVLAGGLFSLESQHQDRLWVQIKHLSPSYWQSHSSKIMKVWFQWISQARKCGLEPKCLQDQVYWQMLSDRLSRGFAEEQKYCLGIINQSLLLAQRDINTKAMVYCVGSIHQKAYEQYTTLFRTIVLNRYANQVEACLPELTLLLGPGSKITPIMAASLLAAALDSRVQEGVRKLIGYWYIDHASETDGVVVVDINFFAGSFLPWSTEGSLFTSSLKSDREETVCSHGDALANVIARLVATEGTVSGSEDAFPQHGAVIISEVVRFVKNAGGRIFQPSIIYLLQGLLNGLQERAETGTLEVLKESFNFSELENILTVARLTGLPEISSDLVAIYCHEICRLIRADFGSLGLSGSGQLLERVQKLNTPVDENTNRATYSSDEKGETYTVERFAAELKTSRHKSIQGDNFARGCKTFMDILNRTELEAIPPQALYNILQAFWDESERCEFGRQVATHLPPMLFHSSCIAICVEQHSNRANKDVEDSMQGLLSRALLRLQHLSKGRSYIFSVLTTSIRTAFFSNSSIAVCLPLKDFILEYVNDPPASKTEFLFEVAAAEKLEHLVKHKTYTSYYGPREWHAYAALIDLMHRWPEEQLSVAQNILKELFKPWREQHPPIPIKSPWKDTLQLQAMLILSDYCISESNADDYLDSLTHALSHEPWPRYRYLLEWIIARIYSRFPGKTSRILYDLERASQYSPAHIASIIKLGLLVAPFESEEFTTGLLLNLVCFSASPKVQIRHEANFAYPLLFSLAEEREWKNISDSATFVALNNYIRQMDKFHADPWTIRTLRLDAVKDFSIVDIFQGRYLTIESPEKERAAYEDFITLQNADNAANTWCPSPRIPLGEKMQPIPSVQVLTTRFKQDVNSKDAPALTPAFLQTKAGFDIDSVYPPPDSPFAKNQRPASVILVASLIDNPTNLGGLSRISESFGLEALYIDDLKKTAHKDFKATSVTSEKHFPIRVLKIPDVPQFLIGAKRKGYIVVGVEQTDRSGILGQDDEKEVGRVINDKHYRKDVGTLPKRCVLVLGSEKGGITPEVLTVIDRCVEIKTVGVTRSLNVQTAGGIAVYEWWREWGGKN
ncbi:hypothetical protein T440DRAFT_67395 [Plenodomus tracheiphilus IPT5]|uniref:tRNA/rRNA methyltransferase SpoU type domain-containing protein n=1 Tax=Plenodomus tracheiphilus IPT5 TaxID=1408161 RepID=A0A6A7BA23_9PLEO|nr:hypothetical protein T440DRAFT_67395 [Plenodomus tracheiphilus IPT5]